MNIDVFNAHLFCHFQQTVEVLVVAVHAAVGKQADEVQRGAVFFCVIHGVYERFVLKERTVLYRLRDAGKLLINDAACADVGVSYFRVAHLTGGNRVALRFSNSETVQNHEYNRSFHSGDAFPFNWKKSFGGKISPWWLRLRWLRSRSASGKRRR